MIRSINDFHYFRASTVDFERVTCPQGCGGVCVFAGRRTAPLSFHHHVFVVFIRSPFGNSGAVRCSKFC